MGENSQTPSTHSKAHQRPTAFDALGAPQGVRRFRGGRRAASGRGLFWGGRGVWDFAKAVFECLQFPNLLAF